MRKKILGLIMVVALVISTLTVSFAGDDRGIKSIQPLNPIEAVKINIK